MKTILGLFCAAVVYAAPSVDYRLRFPNAAHHELEVEAAFHGVTQPILEVEMSRSSPGRYALHEFAKNVYLFHAFNSAGQELAVVRPNPYAWNVSAGQSDTVVIRYTVFADHADGTYAGVDATHAHLNPPAVLMWAHGFEHAPVTLHFEPPPGSGWQTATQLKPQPNGVWSAPDLEWLMDSPIELSALKWAEWQVDGQQFRIALHSNSSESLKSFAQKTQAVVLEGAAVFGSLPQYDNGTYTFLLDYLPDTFGDGMEHRDSTSISGSGNFDAVSARVLGTVSHEFFHSWNVRRIRPKSLEPFDFERVNMSGELWFAEGFTNYYGDLLIHRAGFSTLDEFVQGMGRAVNQVLTAPGHSLFSPVEMSQQAAFVDAARSIDATNFRNTYISYYTYGQALAFGLDLLIREQFPGKSLDDWMRVMWRNHHDIANPYTLDDLQKALAEATGDPHFAAAVFADHILGRQPLPYERLLPAAGLVLRKAHPNQVWLGSTRFEDGKIAGPVMRGSPLYNAGLDTGDVISACDGKPVKKREDLDSCLAQHKVGEKVALDYQSRAGNKSATVELAEDPALEITTSETAGIAVDSAAQAFRAAWLSSKTAQDKGAEPIVH